MQFRFFPDFNGDGIGEFYWWGDDVISRQIQGMKYSYAGAAMSSWWGRDSDPNNKFGRLLANAGPQGFQFAIYYEKEGYAPDPTDIDIHDDLMKILNYYALNPAYSGSFLAVYGRPVVFVYSVDDATCEVVDRWKRALDLVQNDPANPGRVRPWVNLHFFAAGPQCANAAGFDWHIYAPDASGWAQAAYGITYSFTVRPGFWGCKTATSDPPVGQPRSVPVWTQNVQAMRVSGARWQLITTFNEWIEGTAVEPAVEWYSASGYGQYQDVLHANP